MSTNLPQSNTSGASTLADEPTKPTNTLLPFKFMSSNGRQQNLPKSSANLAHPTLATTTTTTTTEQPRTKDFGFLPIPKRCQSRPGEPFEFSLALNYLLAATSTFTIANLYYHQPILVQLSQRYNVQYNEVTLVATLVQVGYLVGLLVLTPLGDLVPRRPLLLALVFMTSSLSLGQATVSSYHGFQALALIVGIFTVTPQIVNPLTADLAPPHRRYSAVSITVSGLLAGMVVGRVFAGIITRFSGHPNNTYYFASATQFALLVTLYFFLPDFPKKATGLSYFGILRSMLVLFWTKPVLVQACLIGLCMTSIMVSWWTTLTFLLSDPPFNYNTFEIGLFGLTGLAAMFSVPLVGKLTDRLNPWVVVLLAASGQTAIAVLCLGTAALNLAPVIIACICVDIFHQSNTIGQQGRIYAIDTLSRGRINGVYMAWVFAGQSIGSAAGPKLYLRFGWRASYGLHVGLGGLALLILFARGPNAKGWVGWGGNYSLSKTRDSDMNDAEEDVKETEKDEGKLEDEERNEVEGSQTIQTSR